MKNYFILYHVSIFAVGDQSFTSIVQLCLSI